MPAHRGSGTFRPKGAGNLRRREAGVWVKLWPPAALGAPTAFVVPRNNGLLVTATGPAEVDGPVTGYQYSVNGGAWTAASGPQFLVSGLANGVSYSVQVRGVDSNGPGEASAGYTGTPADVMLLTFDLVSETTVALPLSGAHDVTVYWGDGATTSVVSATSTLPSRTLPVGTVTVAIAGSVERFGRGSISALNHSTNVWSGNNRLVAVGSFGGLGLTSLQNAFHGCSSLTSVPSTLPPTVASLSWMFAGATTFNGDISGWNTSNVTNMANMFQNATTFNQPLNSWNTANVTTMQSMFSGAAAFNQPLNTWNTANVTTMQFMFNNATAFNGDISGWNTSNVTAMNGMFQNAATFNQPVGSWNTSNVTTMQSMFNNAAAFNQPLNSWNTANVTTMSSMFQNAAAFNGDISGWNILNVTHMTNMFSGAAAFNQPLNTWNTIGVQVMNGMFNNATAFNQPLNSWNVAVIYSEPVDFAGGTSTLAPANRPVWGTGSTEGFPTIAASASYAASTSASTHNVTMPSGITAGHLLVMVARTVSGVTANTPSGWTLLTSRSATGVTYIWWKQATGTEGTTAAVTLSASSLLTALTLRVTPANKDFLWSSTVTTLDPPGFAFLGLGHNRYLSVVVATTRRTDNTLTAPDGFTTLAAAQASSTSTGTARVAVARNRLTTLPGSSSVDPPPFVSTGTVDNPHAATILIGGL
jgi:surface protein